MYFTTSFANTILLIGIVCWCSLAVSAQGAGLCGFSYDDGDKGPHNWHKRCDGAYSDCASTEDQSPVDLKSSSPLKDIDFSLNYTNGLEFFVNINPLGIRIDPSYTDLSLNHAQVNGRRYDLIQFHFHTPSEHTLDGEQFDATVHFVHQNSDKQLAVFGVFIQEGESECALLRSIPVEGIPLEGEEKKDVSDSTSPNPLLFSISEWESILPSPAESIYHLPGSLTTPPCNEGVQWVIRSTRMECTKEQVEQWRVRLGANNRPVQKLREDRIVAIGRIANVSVRDISDLTKETSSPRLILSILLAICTALLFYAFR